MCEFKVVRDERQHSLVVLDMVLKVLKRRRTRNGKEVIKWFNVRNKKGN